MKKIQTKSILVALAIAVGSVFLNFGITSTTHAASCTPVAGGDGSTSDCTNKSDCLGAGGVPQSNGTYYTGCSSTSTADCTPATSGDGSTSDCANATDCTRSQGTPQNKGSYYTGCLVPTTQTDTSGTGPTCSTSILPATLCDGNSNSGGVWGILLFVLNILTAGVGIAAVGGFVFVAIMYTTGGDSPERIKKAKDMIVNIVIGLVAFGLMYALLQFIIPGGVFS